MIPSPPPGCELTPDLDHAEVVRRNRIFFAWLESVNPEELCRGLNRPDLSAAQWAELRGIVLAMTQQFLREMKRSIWSELRLLVRERVRAEVPDALQETWERLGYPDGQD